MALYFNYNFSPNSRYDCGPNAAGCGRVSNQAMLNSGPAVIPPPVFLLGWQPEGVMQFANLSTGFNAAGGSRTNGGPNVAGRKGSYNG